MPGPLPILLLCFVLGDVAELDKELGEGQLLLYWLLKIFVLGDRPVRVVSE